MKLFIPNIQVRFWNTNSSWTTKTVWFHQSNRKGPPFALEAIWVPFCFFKLNCGRLPQEGGTYTLRCWNVALSEFALLLKTQRKLAYLIIERWKWGVICRSFYTFTFTFTFTSTFALLSGSMSYNWEGVEVGLLFAEALWLSFNSCRFCNSDLHWEQLFSSDSHKMPKMLLPRNAHNSPPKKCPKSSSHKMLSRASAWKDPKCWKRLNQRRFARQNIWSFSSAPTSTTLLYIETTFPLKLPSSALLSRTLFEQVMLLCVPLKVQLLSGFCFFLLFHIQLRQSHNKVLLLLRRKASWHVVSEMWKGGHNHLSIWEVDGMLTRENFETSHPLLKEKQGSEKRKLKGSIPVQGKRYWLN